MKKITAFLSASLILGGGFLLMNQEQDQTTKKEFLTRSEAHPILGNQESNKLEPHDQWMRIRSYPDGFDQELYLERMAEVRMHAQAVVGTRDVELGLDWQQEGPGNIGGRIDVLTVDPSDVNTIYAGATNGGIFKTTDGGGSWDPIFDEQPYLAIGAITIDPDNSNILYAGTGDRNFTGNSFIGDGIYKSEDAGDNWSNIGLEETGAVTEIIIDPTDTDRIFASTLGNPHVKTGFRGVYRSDDGGETWSNKLFVADSAGVVDLIMDPSNPDVLYAAGYNRMRNYYSSVVSGPNAKIYKTTNGGESWVVLSGGLPATDECRIGLAISNEDPDVVYALYVAEDGLDVKDIYRSSDAGSTWSAIDVYGGPDALPGGVMGGFGWYFGEVYLNPYNNDHLVIPGVEMFQTLDGGDSWDRNVPFWWTYEVHADKHAIAFFDEDSYIIATDGGLYRTDDNGENWEDIENIAITQFYHIDVHPHEDGLYGGGAQDNGSMSGNAASFNEWERLFGGDGFRVTFLDEDEGAAYYETQFGGLRYADPFGGTTNISPDTPGDDRVNWDMPYTVNEGEAELFVGTAHIQLMVGAPFGDYEYISDDLSRVGLGEDVDNTRYHNVTEIDQENDNILYVGTSDGLMWIGERVGGDPYDWNWTNITEDLPNYYITGVRCSPNMDQTTYVCLSGYKSDEDAAYLYRRDGGVDGEWVDVSGNLPDMTVNDILIVPGYENDEYLFAALDGGVYFSENGGEHWEYLGVGMPAVTVSELHLDIPNEKLIAGTYSRSMWSYDVSWMEPIIEDPDDTGIADEKLHELHVYPNPVETIAYVDAQINDKVYVYANNGALIYQGQVTNMSGQTAVDLSSLRAGVYFLQVEDAITRIIVQ
ncbi:T9SS type A sorting domain-containing protein [Crocinitomicaceae bacterium]|nr:T9SS type A sorting domain-containing protein [Crocinitomicaceae bacterium]